MGDEVNDILNELRSRVKSFFDLNPSLLGKLYYESQCEELKKLLQIKDLLEPSPKIIEGTIKTEIREELEEEEYSEVEQELKLKGKVTKITPQTESEEETSSCRISLSRGKTGELFVDETKNKKMHKCYISSSDVKTEFKSEWIESNEFFFDFLPSGPIKTEIREELEEEEYGEVKQELKGKVTKITQETVSEEETDSCRICLARGKTVQHSHFSSSFLRKKMLMVGADMFACPVCCSTHSTALEEDRITTLRTDSALKDVFLAKDWAEHYEEWVGCHLDLDSQTGAGLSAGRAQWLADYSNQSRPVDTIVAMGLEDVPRLETDQFMRELRTWRADTVAHSERFGHKEPNTFSVASLLRPPGLYWHKGSPEPTKAGWVNYKEKIDELNIKIEEFHIEEAGHERWMTGMKMCGIRTKGSKGRNEQHRFKHFQEPESGLDEDKRVLTPDIQAKCLKLMMRYSKCLPPNSES